MHKFFKTTALIILASSTIATAAFADATGLWQGSGYWSYDGASVPCLMNIRFEENETQLRRHKGILQCDLVTMHSDPLAWDKNGSELILEGEAAGSWDENGFEAHESAGENVQVVTKMNTVTGEYREVWSRISDGVEIYDVQAKLKRK